jgi:prepilin-type processing-associated H-X9-DG protein
MEQAEAVNAFLQATTAQRQANGRQSLEGRLMPTLICPSDYLPSGMQHEQNAPGTGGFPLGRYYGLISYGMNSGLIGFQQPNAANNRGMTIFGNPFGPISLQYVALAAADITDGASNTVFYGERETHDPNFTALNFGVMQSAFGWSDGGIYSGLGSNRGINFRITNALAATIPTLTSAARANLANERRLTYGSKHPGGANLAFVDGSVRFVQESISKITLDAICTSMNGDTYSEDF